MSRTIQLQREPLFTGPFLRLWSFSFITFFAAFQLFPTIPFRIMDLGGTKGQAGFFLAFYTWASAVAAPLTGALADLVGRKRLLMFGALAFIVFSALYGVVTLFPLLLTIACIHGVFWSGLLSSSGAIITDIVPITRRTEGLAYWGMAPTAAIAVSPIVGLALYHVGWWAISVSMVLLSCVIAILAHRVRERSETARHRPSSVMDIVDWRVIVSALTLFTISFGYGAITSYVAVMAADRHLEPRSLFFTVCAVTILITRVFVSPLGDRFGPERLLLPSLAFVPFAHVLLAVADSRADIIVAAILFGFGLGGAYPAFITWVLSRSHEGRRAATFGSVLFALDTGIGSGSLVMGQIADTAGFGRGFAVMAAVSVLSIPIFFVTSRILPLQMGSPTDSADTLSDTGEFE